MKETCTIEGGIIMLAEKVRILEKENEELKTENSRMKQLCGEDCKLKKCEECSHFVKYFAR